MKVLMLGWEFPPHISGGLGTACHGLTRGLATHGVEVLFVVPRAYGDEDQRSVQVLGANQVPLFEHVVERPAASAGEPSVESADRSDAGAGGTASGTEPTSSASATAETPRPRAAVLAALADWERIDQSLELLAVDSLLTPYATETSYGTRYRKSSSRRGGSVLALEEPELAVAAERGAARAAVEQFRRHLRGFRELAGEADAIVGHLVETGTLEFTGLYGPNLLSEVARFALVVGEIARRREFDVIHAHDWMAVPAGLVAKHVSGKPLVVHVHASEYDRSGEHVNVQVRDIEQLGLDGADLVVCVSHYTANLLQQRYRVDPAKLRVVHNAVTHRQQVEQLHVEKRIEEPIVLFLGRVTFQKGPDYFLEAAARVVKIEPKVKFVMSGSGDMLPVMVERAARLGLARHVHFTGFLKGDEVERMYAMADIYVMPSVSEPFGISPLEAMALDVPVIMSRQSGVSEILRNALKVDFWDVQDMANKILALLKYPALGEQLTQEGREEIQQIRWEFPAGLVRDVYRELVR